MPTVLRSWSVAANEGDSTSGIWQVGCGSHHVQGLGLQLQRKTVDTPRLLCELGLAGLSDACPQCTASSRGDEEGAEDYKKVLAAPDKACRVGSLHI